MAELGPRFEAALSYATRLHADQLRKSTTIPYISHLLGVASLVIEAGGDEDEAIAALLHDSVEDQGGAATLRLIKRRFGARVGEIVAGCSDTDATPKPPWRARKKAYLKHLKHEESPSIRLVSLADKLHNARAILSDLRNEGSGVWDRFNAQKRDQLWYYRRLADTFLALDKTPMAEELDRVVSKIERLA